LPGEENPVAHRAERILESPGESAIVPSLWWYEVRNILIVNERRGRITQANTTLFLNQTASLRIFVDSNMDERLLLDLSRQARLTVYDAAYLALAMRERLPPATLDKALEEAALAAGVALLA